MKKTIVILLLFALLLPFAACSGTDVELVTSRSADEGGSERRSGLFLNAGCFGGLLDSTMCYEINAEKGGKAPQKTVTFAGQTFTLDFFDRETTRVYSESNVIDEDNVIHGDGALLRSYDSYKGTNGDMRMRAAFTGQETRPNLVEVSGDGVLVLEGKTEAELKRMAETWLSGTFLFNVSTEMDCVFRSVTGSGVTEGFIPGAAQYLLTYTEQVGVFMTRYAAVTMKENQVALLVRDHYDARATVDSGKTDYRTVLTSTGKEQIETLVASKILDSQKKIVYLKVRLTGTPVFDACGDFVYIEFDASVDYRVKNETKTENIAGLLTVDLL